MTRRIVLSIILCLVFASYAGAQEVGTNIESLLSSQGKILYGDEPNSLVVIDYDDNLQRIADYLSVIDVEPQQVLIESRVVEVRLQKEHSLGINWTAFAAKDGFKLGEFVIGSTAGVEHSPLLQNIPFKEVYDTPGQSTSAVINPFTVNIFDENLNVVLQALASTLDTDILSAPRITTVNNKQATIKVIQSYPWAEPQVDTSDSGAITVTWTIHFEEIGILLTATPTINENGNITLDLAPEVSEKVDDLTLTVQGLTYKVPIIDKRTASTRVVIGSGQTLIIGGLIKDKKINSDAKIPLIADIPWVGNLFKSKKTYTEKVELLIFVSPTIISQQEISRMGKEYKFGVGARYEKDKAEKHRRVMVNDAAYNTEQEKKAEYLMNLFDEHATLSAERSRLEAELTQQKKELDNLKQETMRAAQ